MMTAPGLQSWPMRIQSHSSLDAFESCPRQYWYRYIGKPEVEEVDTVEAFLGTCAHATLETLYRARLGGRVLSEEETLAGFDSEWAKGWSDGIRIVSKELGPDDYRRAGREALASYHRRNAPFDAARTLRLEAEVVFDLDRDGRHRMKGYIDRLARRENGTYEIHDYKTSSFLPTQAEADEDRQLALYQIGLETMWSDVKEVDLIWHYVRFDTDLVSHRTPEQLDAVQASCVAVMDDIESRGREEERFPTKPSRLCDWCAFRAICPATRHEVATAALPPEAFKDDDGVRLVDAWAEAVEKRKVLEAEVAAAKTLEDTMKSRVEAFAARDGLEAVVGSRHRAEIAVVSGVEFPKAGAEERPDFEAALKETGVWERVVSPSHGKLASLLSDPEGLPPEARSRLERFLSPFERLTAKLKKRKAQE